MGQTFLDGVIHQKVSSPSKKLMPSRLCSTFIENKKYEEKVGNPTFGTRWVLFSGF
jgi:hypothetical protein